QALDLYEQVLGVVSAGYPDRGRATLGALFELGVQELRFALEEDLFRRLYLPGARPAAVNAFKAKLAAWPARKFVNRAEARDPVLVGVRAAQREGLALRPAAVAALALEFAAGACNGLDEHSSLLVPGSFAGAALRSKRVGVGLELAGADEKLHVARVF